MIEEVYYACPHCGEPVSALVDTSQARQDYIEDCEVCCRPVRLQVVIEGDDVSLQAEAET
jgi:uncharacterized Zn finger protein